MKQKDFWQFIGRNILSLLTVAGGLLVLVYQRVVGFHTEQMLTAILIILCMLATSQIIESSRKFEEIGSKLDRALYERSVECFESPADGVIYAIHRLREAKKDINQVSLSPSLRTRPTDAYSEFEKTIRDVAVSSQVRIRYIANLEDNVRLKRVRELRANPRVKNFLVKCFNPAFLSHNRMLNFFTIDGETLIVFIPGPGEQDSAFAVKNIKIVSAFEKYFLLLWDKAEDFDETGKSLSSKHRFVRKENGVKPASADHRASVKVADEGKPSDQQIVYQNRLSLRALQKQ